uniref:Uncharacterized protein n=1 Tax=Sciurus vulgaris TaxID=55149 RepID=A0A8D2CRC5_SCIVU
MSISALSLTRRLGGISGFLQLASLLGLLLLLFKAVHFLLHRQWLLKALQQFPSPPSHWFFGHKVGRNDKASCMHSVPEEHPDYLPAGLIPVPGAHSLNRNPKAPSTYRCLAPWIGYGLLLLNGQKWFQHRQMLTPAFHYDILKTYMGIMADSVRVMLDKWEQLIGQDSLLEIFQHVSLMTLDTIMKCAFKYQSSIQLDRNSQSYIKAVGDLNYFIFSRVRNVFHQNDTFYRLTTDGRLFHQACPFAHEHTDKVIRQRKAQLQNEGELEKVRRKRHLDFLDILLSAGRRSRAFWGMEPPLPGE